MTEIEQEKQEVQRAVEISRLTADMMQYQERENKRLWAAVIVLALAFCVMAGCMVWTVQNAQRVATEAATQAIRESQEVMNEAMLTALDMIAEIGVTEETTTTTVTQDTGEGTGNNVYQQEGGTYNESGVE